MITARWRGAVLASSEDTVVVEGNHYFRPSDVDMAYLEPSSHHTVCAQGLKDVIALGLRHVDQRDT